MDNSNLLIMGDISLKFSFNHRALPSKQKCWREEGPVVELSLNLVGSLPT